MVRKRQGGLMKKLLLPTLAITSLMLGAACDMNKKTSRTTSIRDNSDLTASRVNPGISEDLSQNDEVSTSASSTSAYGASAGSAAAGNATFNSDTEDTDEKSGVVGGAVINNNNKSSSSSIERSSQEDVSRPALIEDDQTVVNEEPDYSEFARQSMEESEYQAYPSEGDSDNQLDKLEDEYSIFYGNPGATGRSGAPGTRDLEDLNNDD